MRRGQVMEMLQEEGLNYRNVRTLLETGAIVALKLPGREDGRALYSRAQIERDVLKKLDV